MRIPFPVHIRISYVVGFAATLSVIQLLQGTSPFFSLCCSLFIVISGFAFNLAGGFSRPSGGYIFWYAVLAFILGIFWKAVNAEPADSNLLVPNVTVLVYLATSIALLIAVYISRKFTRKRGLLADLVTTDNMQHATIGCMITGMGVAVVLMLVPHENGSALSALSQLNKFLPMAIILGVIHKIRISGGTRSVSLPVLLSSACIFSLGLIGFSKEGMFTPLVCWIVAAGSQEYKISRYQLIGLILGVTLIFKFLVPYSQYGRNFRDTSASISENLQIAVSLLSDLESVRALERASQNETYDEGNGGYFNEPQGLFDRLQMISVDDALISVTERDKEFGLYPILFSFENLVPHVFWPDKPTVGFGNLYSHEIGGIADDDTTTGISYSPSGEAFHMARWAGVLIVAPILWIALFTLFDSLCGDARQAPWGLLVIAVFSHMAPEGLLTGVVYMLGYTSLSIIFAAFCAAYVMPLLAVLVAGPGRRRIQSIPLRRPIVSKHLS